MITSANVAGPAVPLGSRMPRRRPGAIQSGIRAVGALGRRRKVKAVGGLVRVEALTPVAVLDEGVGMRMAGLLGRAAGRAVGKAAGQAAKKGWGAAKDAMSPAMRHKIAVLGGKAAALKRHAKRGIKQIKQGHKQRVKAFNKLGVVKGVRKVARGIHAAYQTAKAQEATAKVGRALQAARKGGDKELVRALSMMQQGLGRGDAKRVKAAAAALTLIAKHRAGGGTGPSPHAAKALASRGGKPQPQQAPKAKAKRKPKAPAPAQPAVRAVPDAASPLARRAKRRRAG